MLFLRIKMSRFLKVEKLSISNSIWIEWTIQT
jgi:hypothetical protein